MDKYTDKLMLVLVIVGALNWGLVGLFKFDLVAALFGNKSLMSRLVYSLVGMAGAYSVKLLVEEQSREPVGA
jgi:uncharacterized protein